MLLTLFRRTNLRCSLRYFGKIQDKDDDYYMQFNLVICGLDSVEARRWINATLVNLVDPENPESLKPLIDGGTEGQCGYPKSYVSTSHSLSGFKGQARVILPTITSCYECSLDMLNKPTAFPICTIANTPRLPEHCIEWASVLEWPRVHGGMMCMKGSFIHSYQVVHRQEDGH